MKKLSNLALISICLLLAFFTSSINAVTYTHSIKLPEMSFDWKVDGDLLRIKLEAKTKGWAAIGFNPKNGMAGADFVIGYVKRGKAKLQDHYGVRTKDHIRDIMNNGTDDIKDASGSEKGATTILEFAIPLNSGDENDTKIDPNGNNRVLLAYGPRDSFHVRHKYRTALTVNLKTGEYKQ